MSASVIEIERWKTAEGARVSAGGEQGLCIVATTSVAGARHVAGIAQIVAGLSVGDRLTFERDRDNIYDAWSVRVYTRDHVRIGYVSCECNEVVARLMDGGKQVYGIFEGASSLDAWTRIEMGVYLDD